MLDPIPSINRVLSMLMQDETHREIGSATMPMVPDAAQAFAVQSDPSNKPKQGNVVVLFMLSVVFLATGKTNAISTAIHLDIHMVLRKGSLQPHLLLR